MSSKIDDIEESVEEFLEKEEDIFSALTEEPMTAREAVEETGYRMKIVKYSIQDLLNKGRIETTSDRGFKPSKGYTEKR